MLNEKDVDINRAREEYEVEMKKKVEESTKTIEKQKTIIMKGEIAKIKEEHDKQLQDKEEAHTKLLYDYNEKCQSWQQEKQVTNIKKRK